MPRRAARILTLTTALFVLGCGTGESDPCRAPAGETPAAAYERLFSAVKSKQTEAIKAEMSAATIELAGMVSAQNKTPLEKVFENGFTATTFADSLPEVRDQRVDCGMGAVEVWNGKERRWEDIPFVLEDSKWKLAFGDLFKNTYRSPGKGRAIKEAEAANAAMANDAPHNGNVNTKNSAIPMRPPVNTVRK